MLFAEVAVASAVNRQGQLFTYAVPDCLSGDVVAGQLVHVPFGQRKLQGIVISLTEKAPSFDAREIEAVVDTSPVLHRPQISLLLWITDYYRCSTGEVIRLFLPPGLSQQAVPVVWLKPEVSVDLGRLTAEEGSVTSLLQQRGPLSVTRIRSILHLRGLEKVLKELERKGWLSSAYVWEKTLAHPRYDRFVALAENRDSCSDGDRRSPLGPRQAAVLRYLQDSAHRGVNVGSAGESEWLPVGDVLRETDARMTTVRALENAGLVRLESREVSRSSLKARFFPLSEPPTLTLAQGLAWREIAGGLLGGEHKVYLLHGVTGSGKTEIYLRAITRAIRLQKKAIVLVPEIALTPDMLRRFAARFPGRIAVMHSRLSPGERFDEWRRIRSGEVDIVIGSRSAIFSPVPNLGLIVVDEEHEWSYKQEQRPRYHAREVAVKLGEFAGATVVLGSATPDVVTYFRATRGDYHRLELPHRVGQAQADRRYEIAPELALPPVEVVDLRQELKAGNGGIFSRSLHRSLRQAIARGDQAILFLNRRGSATLVLCRNCGHVLRCHRCTFSLVYHRAERELICHYCSRRSALPSHCPVCGSPQIRQFGIGTQKVEEEISKLFPGARVLRWDRDVTGAREAHDQLLRRFVDKEADILVGTQMIAKGFDFPDVTLVGVISADTGLHLPDFRSAERCFQMLTQVAGRAGRRRPGSKVIIQTFNPEHFSIRAAARHNYRLFYQQEIVFRRELGYPPFKQLVRFVYTAKSETRCEDKSQEFARVLYESIRLKRSQGVDVLGPAPCYLQRLRDHYRWQLVVRCPDASDFLKDLMIPVGWTVDIDPVNML